MRKHYPSTVTTAEGRRLYDALVGAGCCAITARRYAATGSMQAAWDSIRSMEDLRWLMCRSCPEKYEFGSGYQKRLLADVLNGWPDGAAAFHGVSHREAIAIFREYFPPPPISDITGISNTAYVLRQHSSWHVNRALERDAAREATRQAGAWSSTV